VPREDFRTKAQRLLGEGRLTVQAVTGKEIRVTCRGDSGEVYRVGYSRGGWSCDCAALGRCSHLQALMLVTIRPGDPFLPSQAPESNRPGWRGIFD
jgi:hypothetical protein